MPEDANGGHANGAERASADGRAEPLRELLRPRSTAEQIADRLVTALALGEFIPGQRLPTERQLAATLSVSRGRIRSALHQLAEQGYVDIRRGRHGGAFVRSDWAPSSATIIRRTLLPDWEHTEELLDFVAMIEPVVARACAERRTAKDVRAIHAAARAYRDARDRSESAAADEAYHLALGAATHNSYLADLSSRLRQAVTLGFRAHPYSPAIREAAIGQHEQLAQLIAEQRGDEAAELMQEHVRLTDRAVRALVDRVRSGEDPPG
jgi:GntR family transcriptional regulator, transcriptional repressor for pyruvate dehydrogenase complex